MENIKENWKKTFGIIFTGQLFSIITSSIVQYAIIWYLTFKTGSAWVLTIATIVGLLPQMLLGLFAGVIVDRVDRKKIMMISDGLVGLCSFILAILFFTNEPNLIIIYSALAIRSIGSAFHAPALQASVPLLAPEDKIVKVTAVNQTIMSVSYMLSPVIAGAIYGIMPLYLIILLDTFGAILGMSSIALIAIPKLKKLTEKKKVIHEMIDGLKEIKNHKVLALITLYITILVILYMPAGSLFPLIISNYFNYEPIHASIVELAFALGMFFGGILMIVWAGFKKKQYTVILSGGMFGLFLALSGLVPTNLTGFIIFTALCVSMGITVSYFNGIYTALVQLTVAPERLGRVFSFINSIMLLGTPVGLLFAAPIAERIGVNNLFVASGLLIVLISIISISLKQYRIENIVPVSAENESETKIEIQ